MRFTEFKRRLAYRARRHSSEHRRLVVFLLCVTPVLVLIYCLSHLSPMVVELALANATDAITLTVNDVISDKVLDGSVGYDDLVTLEKDSEGNITALVTNMANINVLQAEITNAIVERFSETDVTRVSIPLGNLIGGAILSGKGPMVSVDILSVTNVNTAFRNEFSSAGINQTRHRIMMDVEVTLGILLAGYDDMWDSVTTEVTVAETVIVGAVPNTFASLG